SPSPRQQAEGRPDALSAAPANGSDVKLNTPPDLGAIAGAGNAAPLETGKTVPADGPSPPSAIDPPLPQPLSSAAPARFVKILLQGPTRDVPPHESPPTSIAAGDDPSAVPLQSSDDRAVFQAVASESGDPASSRSAANPDVSAANSSRSANPLFVQAPGGS